MTISLARHERLFNLARGHACFTHPFFEKIRNVELSRAQIAGLLRNYDAHASALRRLLLKAAALMPEEAVGFVLENVRNEYGNGDPDKRHQLQLVDLARQAGVSQSEFEDAAVLPPIRAYIRRATELYYPLNLRVPNSFYKPAIVAGAITGTEIMAIEEFKALQVPFFSLGLEKHVWFDHIEVECAHSDESTALVNYFIEKHAAFDAVQYGFKQILDANILLYDGLLQALAPR